MLQGVIARMGSNSFTLKALSASFGSAAIAALSTADKPSPYFSIAAMIPIAMFWLMDAQYLKYEKAYRRLFEDVRTGVHTDSYSMDPEPFMNDVEGVLKVAISWSLAPFYLAIMISFTVVSIVLFGK
ncbi:MAG: hypothetical protein O9283_05855 [Sphingomonadaceae bacterium]|nr:hypothetical protein [Sphingomonadaceae bacterium]